MAGHLFGYEAALAIDAQARPLREARAAIEVAVVGDADRRPTTLLARLRPALEPPGGRVLRRPARRRYDGHLEASTAVRLASLLRYAIGIVPLDAYQVEHGTVGTPSVVVEDLTAALTAGIEELTRPVDAIKHQAKTVTVGISRSDEDAAPGRRWCARCSRRAPPATRSATAPCARWPRSTRRSSEVVGFTRYRIEGDVDADDATIHVVDRGGIAARPALAHRRRPPTAGHQAPRRHASARSRSPAAAATGAP